MQRLSLVLLCTIFAACSSSSEPTSDGGKDPGTDMSTTQDGAVVAADSTPAANCTFGSTLTSSWIDVAAGNYGVGSPADEPCRDEDERQRTITLTRGFAISAHETTQAHFATLMGYQPSFQPGCDDCPVESVNWHEAANYCNALSGAEGKAPCYRCSGCGEATRCEVEGDLAQCTGYRLPTEAEWEIAARAGSESAFYSGAVTSTASLCMGTDSTLEAIGWYKVNSTGMPHAVGQKNANAWGLYDMAGNIYEWTQDWYAADPGGDATDPMGPASGSEKVFRGGAWYYNAHHARSANRERFAADKRFNFVGFRCVIRK